MSTVTITELIPGDNATSSAVNQTISSLNTATAAGALVGTNFRVEGIDRRPLARGTNLVEGDTSASDYFDSSSSAAVSSAGVYTVIVLGGINLQTPSPVADPPSTSKLLVHARVRIQSAAIPTTASLPHVYVALQQSTDNVTYTTITGQVQDFRMRDLGTAYVDPVGLSDSIPGVAVTVGFAARVTPSGTDDYYFRLAFKTDAAETFVFSQGVITVEHLLRC